MKSRWVVAVMVLGLVVPALATQPEEPTPEPEVPTTAPAEETKGETVRVAMQTTLGEIVLELDPEKAPITVQNFLEYVRGGYYAGTIFHRVIPTFMVQGGGFTPDMEQKNEGMRPAIKSESKNGLKNLRGTIAMARTADPDSATSQFFINVVDNPNLDYPKPDTHGYTVFGKVVEGMEVVDKIRDAETQSHPKYPAGKVVPVEPILIESVRIVEEGAAVAPKPATRPTVPPRPSRKVPPKPQAPEPEKQPADDSGEEAPPE